MPGAHRHGDARRPACGATTKVEGQSTVSVNDKLWAVEGDPNTHKNGKLKAVYGTLDVFVEDKLVIVAIGDTAGGDDEGHSPSATDPFGASGDVSAY